MKLILQMRNLIHREFWGLFKYGIVGGTSLLIHVGLYTWISRVVWTSGSRTLQYVITLLTASSFNFFMHRIWTFQVKSKTIWMLMRYAIVVASSIGLQSLVFYFVNDILHFHDTFAFAGAACIAIAYQYFGHRFVTYNKKFEKKDLAYSEPPVL